MSENSINHYKERNDWHKNNIKLASEYFKNQCQICNRITTIKNGAIHHLQYTGHDYKKTFEKLIEQKAITWLCKECHKFEHIAYSKSEVNFKTKHSGYCAVCNSFSWYGWYKLGFGHMGGQNESPFPLCDKCVEELIKTKVLVRERGTTYGGRDIGEFINFTNPEERDEKGKRLLLEVNKKIKNDVFGDRRIKENWQISSSGEQLGLLLK